VRPSLRLLPLLLLACAAPATARSLHANIARVSTAVATLERVTVHLDWPAKATEGRLELRAGSVIAPDLGYRWRDLAWRCPLQRDGNGGWRCDGELRTPRGRPLRLSLVLGTATTDAVLQQGNARIALARSAATPDLTTLDITHVPIAWTQALLAQAWPGAQLRAGTLDGHLDIHSPDRGPLDIGATLRTAGLKFDTPDATTAGENLAGRFEVDARIFEDRTLVAVEGALHGGEFLSGSTYVALPATPIALSIAAERSDKSGWHLPRFAWRDGNVLEAAGSIAFDRDAAVRDLDVQLHSNDIAPLRDRYLSGWLGLASLGDLGMRGAIDGDIHLAGGQLQSARLQPHRVFLDDPKGRFRFDALDGELRFSGGAPEAGTLRWDGGALYGLAFGAAALPIESRDGQLRLCQPVDVPMLGGNLRFDGFTLRPRKDEAGAEATFGLSVEHLDIGQLAQAFGWPAFRGELTGRLPQARYANERLDFEGGLSMSMFDGSVEVSSLSMERPFGVAPTLAADLAIDDLDLLALTEVFDFGSITGRLDGRIEHLRLVDWTVTGFDADLHTDPKAGVPQRISQRAVQNISSVGDASFVSSLQGRLIGLFDDFGYARIGIGCTLVNEVCAMRGLRSAGNTFTIVDGAGLPRLTVVGYNRMVDWPTLVERVAAVGKGDVKPVVE
jgi:hypothetical protein